MQATRPLRDIDRAARFDGSQINAAEVISAPPGGWSRAATASAATGRGTSLIRPEAARLRQYASDLPFAEDSDAGVTALPGRESDLRVAQIGFTLATRSVARCASPTGATGLLLQHLSQFETADRPGIVQAYSLDRGPGTIAVVPGSPAAEAGLRAGDVILAIDDVPVHADDAAARPFDAAVARARADAVYDLLDRGAGRGVSLTVLRASRTLRMTLTPAPACPSRLHLARSSQRNAYADGRHVFVTTALIDVMRSDDELAFVLAHEMAHNILGHAAIMRGGDVRRGLGRTFGKSGRIVRAAEDAADALAGEMLLDAGYDPVAGADVLKRLGGGDLGIALFTDHASAGRRIAAMRTIAERRRGR